MKDFRLMEIANEPCVEVWYGVYMQSAVCKKTITNLAGVQNFEVISIKFNVDGICAYIISH
jgi:hypothetical protein